MPTDVLLAIGTALGYLRSHDHHRPLRAVGDRQHPYRHERTALFNWLFALRHGVRFVLRQPSFDFGFVGHGLREKTQPTGRMSAATDWRLKLFALKAPSEGYFVQPQAW